MLPNAMDRCGGHNNWEDQDMGTTRLFLRSVLTLGLVAVVSSYGLAAERSSAAREETALKRASRIMNARVVSRKARSWAGFTTSC